jgi:transketolase
MTARISTTACQNRISTFISSSTSLDSRSRYLRNLVIDALEGGERGHVGSSMSLIEIVRVLYDDILKQCPAEPHWPERDRCILSKGHGCLALYALLADHGYFPKDTLKTFCRFDSILGGHPDRSLVAGVEASTGSLGHGLSIGVGMALSARMKKQSYRVFVIMGDGEINEGSVWEAALAAGKHGLSNLIAIIDYNKIQSYGETRAVQPLEPLLDKWEAFGFDAVEVDGHDVEKLRETFAVRLYQNRPLAVICHTVKGKGISYAEHDPNWHHVNKVTPQMADEMRRAING